MLFFADSLSGESFMKAKAVGIVNTITDEDLRVLAKAYHVDINKKFLN